MAQQAIFEDVVSMIWFALQQRVRKDDLFKTYFFHLDVLYETAVDAGLSFCPGLQDVLGGEEPPELDFFKKLPGKVDKRWAVYAIVLQKVASDDLIYVGSATHATNGVAGRFHTYDNVVHYSKPSDKKSAVPKYMAEAVRDGYQISHKGLLAWCDNPQMADIARYRLLLVAMESAFSFRFWTMKCRDKDYGIGALCLWPMDAFTYHGLCGHNSLIERIRGEFDLTPEQVKALAAAAKARRSVQNSKSYKRLREQDLEGYLARKRREGATYRVNSADKKRVNEQRFREKVVREKRFYCKVCARPCIGEWELDRHNSSRRHQLTVERAAKGMLKHRCVVCNVGFTLPCHLNRHYGGQRHQEKAAALVAHLD